MYLGAKKLGGFIPKTGSPWPLTQGQGGKTRDYFCSAADTLNALSEGTKFSDFSLDTQLIACSSSPHPHNSDTKCSLGQISKIPAPPWPHAYHILTPVPTQE